VGRGLRSSSRSLKERSVPRGGASLNSLNSVLIGAPLPRGPSGADAPVPGPGGGPLGLSLKVLGPLGGSSPRPKSPCLLLLLLLLNPGFGGPFGLHPSYLGGDLDRARGGYRDSCTGGKRDDILLMYSTKHYHEERKDREARAMSTRDSPLNVGNESVRVQSRRKN
jgi:hypothetical protein